jgi:ATP-dependent RNA helicase RhlE
VSFASFTLDPRLSRNVAALGYEIPTPIQRDALPPALAGRDVLGIAQTGTGKTAAFGLPLLQRLLATPAQARPRALILAPTRELAQQIHDALGTFAAGLGLRTLVLYGGVGIPPQVQALRRGVDILVACPGRLLDHLRSNHADLGAVEVLVLDEADRMFDMGFLPDVRRILARLPARRQNLLFSATMPPDVRRLADEVLREPVRAEIAFGAPAATVNHTLYPVPQHLKTALLQQLLQRTDTGSVLVFTRTKHRARRVGQQLERAGFKAAFLQGNLSQNRRRAAMDGFRDGTHRILVATDIAARGLDVASISHVINYDMPDTVDAYTHRIGRTGRAARNGDAFTLVTPDDAGMIRAIERVLGCVIERRTLDGFDYTAAAPVEPRMPAPTRPQPRSPHHPSRTAGHHRTPSAAGRGGPRRFQGRGTTPRPAARSPGAYAAPHPAASSAPAAAPTPVTVAQRLSRAFSTVFSRER